MPHPSASDMVIKIFETGDKDLQDCAESQGYHNTNINLVSYSIAKRDLLF